MIKCLVLLSCAIVGVFATSHGALPAACDNLTPDHGVASQVTQNPFTLSFAQSQVESGASVEVTIHVRTVFAPDFKGYLIQARDKRTGNAIGEFHNLDSNMKYVDCAGKPERATLTHRNPDPKREVKVMWRHPVFTSGQNKEIEFRFAVVQSISIYWANQISAQSLIVTPNRNGQVVTTTQPPGNSPRERMPEVYEGCFTTKGCFGTPNGCEEKGNCDVMFSYNLHPSNNNTLNFGLHGVTSSDYFAVGFSDDQSMGEDLVFACVPSQRRVSATWNEVGIKNNADLIESASRIFDESISTTDGITSCTFSIPKTLTVRVRNENSPRQYTLAGEQINYHILVAQGPLLPNNRDLAYHTSRISSSSMVDLTGPSRLAAPSNANSLVKAHGIVMVLAWMAAASTGIFFARYMKQTWKDVQIFGKDSWFIVHQGSMIFTVLMNILGFILIASDKGLTPYLSYKINPHPILGTVSILLALIQPVMAAFRCHPNTPKRPIFNWAHWFVGNSAWLFGIITIFFAANLGAADFIPTREFYVIIGVWLAIFIVYHFIMTILRFLSDRKSASSDLELKTPNQPEQNPDQKESKVDMRRKGIAIAFVLFVWVYAIAISVLIGIGQPGRDQWI